MEHSGGYAPLIGRYTWCEGEHGSWEMLIESDLVASSIRQTGFVNGEARTYNILLNSAKCNMNDFLFKKKLFVLQEQASKV